MPPHMPLKFNVHLCSSAIHPGIRSCECGTADSDHRSLRFHRWKATPSSVHAGLHKVLLGGPWFALHGERRPRNHWKIPIISVPSEVLSASVVDSCVSQTGVFSVTQDLTSATTRQSKWSKVKGCEGKSGRALWRGRKILQVPLLSILSGFSLSRLLFPDLSRTPIWATTKQSKWSKVEGCEGKSGRTLWRGRKILQVPLLSILSGVWLSQLPFPGLKIRVHLWHLWFNFRFRVHFSLQAE
jgi:hypothetical protein